MLRATTSSSRLVSFRPTAHISSQTVFTRRYSSSKSEKKPKWPLYLSLAGLAGLGLHTYLGWEDKKQVERPAQEKSPLDPKEFVDFKLKRVEPYNHNTSRFIFELPDQQASLLPVASCVLIKSADAESLLDKTGKPIVRPYTPISPPDKPGELAFLVKKYDTGNASKHIHSLKPGDQLSIKGPIMKFDYKLNEFTDVALIGGGSGITPLYQILDHALSQKSNTTRFKLIFANVEEQDILLREEFELMKKKYPKNFDVIYTLDKSSKNWDGPTGYIQKSLLEEHLPSASLGDKVKVFVCGPPGQVSVVAGKKDGMKQGEVGGLLKELGYSSNQVFKF